MAEKVVDVNDFRKEQKKREFKEKVVSGIRKGLEWVDERKEWLVIIVPAAVKGGSTIAKVVSKHSSLRKEKELKDLRCYDRSGGHYWRLKRELTTQEWLEFDKRRGNGERVADILADMRVLK